MQGSAVHLKGYWNSTPPSPSTIALQAGRRAATQAGVGPQDTGSKLAVSCRQPVAGSYLAGTARLRSALTTRALQRVGLHLKLSWLTLSDRTSSKKAASAGAMGVVSTEGSMKSRV